MKFPLGTVTVTFAASAALRLADVHLQDLLDRHVGDDCGDCAFEPSALDNGEQIVASYRLPRLEVSICVITEGDRHSTFVGFVEEYRR